MKNLEKEDNIKIIKVGCGDFDEGGEKMVDGIFTFKDKRFSISTFHFYGSAKITNFADLYTYKRYFLNLALEINNGTFEKSFLVFNKDVNEDEEFKKVFDETLATLDKKLTEKIVLVSGSLEEIKAKIIKQL
jgi:hypothetical protein